MALLKRLEARADTYIAFLGNCVYVASLQRPERRKSSHYLAFTANGFFEVLTYMTLEMQPSGPPPLPCQQGRGL